MAKTPDRELPPADAAPDELLRQREQLIGWLEQLRAEPGDAPPHVLERVASDYQQRLDRVTQALAEHADTLRAEAEQTEVNLQEVVERHRALRDEMAELGLRERVGELSADDVHERRTELEQQMADVSATREQLEQELERARDILGAIDAGGAAPPQVEIPATGLSDEAPADEVRLEEEPTGAEDLILASNPNAWDMEFGEMDMLPALEALAAQTGEQEGDQEELKVDLGFLEELDRRIADSLVPQAGPDDQTVEAEGPDAPGPDTDQWEGQADPEKAPPPGIRCEECGYTNPREAAYCEVCDADLL